MKKILFFALLSVMFCLFAPNIHLESQSTDSDSDKQSAFISIDYQQASAYELGESTNVTEILAKQAGENGEWVHDVYKISLSFVNIIAICFLLFVAIANILNYDIQKYAIKAVLPRLVGAIIAANLSMTVLVLASRFIDSLQAISIFRPLGPGGWAEYVFGGNVWQIIVALAKSLLIGAIGAVFTGGNSFVLMGLVTALLVLFSLVIIVLLALIFGLRPYIILLCAAIAPIAIVCYALPQTQKHFERWLKIIFPWLVLPVLTNFILNVTKMIPANTEMTVGGLGILSALAGFFFPTLLRTAVLLFVIRLPFRMETDISGLIAKSGKWVGGNAWKWGVGYGMGAGAYQAQKRARTEKQKQFGSQITGIMAENPGMTREQAEAQLRGTLDQERRQNLDRLNRDDRVFGALQKYNPYGISAAFKERGELIDKNIKKAYFRNNLPTELAIGDEGWLKHQQEIQAADFSKLYETRAVEANMGSNYAKLARAWRETRDGIESDGEASDDLLAILERLDTEQAASIDYLDYFRECLGTGDNRITVQQLSNIIEGYNRSRFTIASESRGFRNADDIAADRRRLASESGRRMVGASGSPEESEQPAAVGPSNAATDQDQYQGEAAGLESEPTSMPKVELLLESIRDQMKKQGGASDEKLRGILTNRSLFGDIDNENLLEAYRRSDRMLQQIEIALTKKMPFENAREFVRRIRSTGGLAVQSEADAGRDPELSELIEQYNTARIVQMGTRLQTEPATSAQMNAQMIARQMGQGADIAQLQQSILKSAETINSSANGAPVSPSDLSEAKQYIGKIIGRSGETISDENATRLVSGAEILFARDKSGRVVTVDDPVKLQTRAVIQQERDIGITDLGVHTQDLKRKIEERKKTGRETITAEETVRLSNKISAIVEPHMELKYSEQWQTQPDQMKDKIIADVTNSIRGALIETPTTTEQDIDITSAGIGAQLLAEQLFESRIK